MTASVRRIGGLVTHTVTGVLSEYQAPWLPPLPSPLLPFLQCIALGANASMAYLIEKQMTDIAEPSYIKECMFISRI